VPAKLLREKSSTGSRSEFRFIPKGALRKTGAPAKFILWGIGTVGCRQKTEVQNRATR
jgi:hypothetical protein